jgi:hypothetical protein
MTSAQRGARERSTHARAWQQVAGTQSRSVTHCVGRTSSSCEGVMALPPGPTAGGISLPRPLGGDGCSAPLDAMEGFEGIALCDNGPGSA